MAIVSVCKHSSGLRFILNLRVLHGRQGMVRYAARTKNQVAFLSPFLGDVQRHLCECAMFGQQTKEYPLPSWSPSRVGLGATLRKPFRCITTILNIPCKLWVAVCLAHHIVNRHTPGYFCTTLPQVSRFSSAPAMSFRAIFSNTRVLKNQIR